ncbi:flavodoxin family protein [Pontibacillus salicampi]|uniref:Flavodoxin family protein n=1 Tax=Pontibacillus salicampi TaxID=1449801 RepID=A0ABV6LK99_9BACI
MSIVMINGGSRENGNTNLLSARAVHGLEVDIIQLDEYNISPIVDERHAEGGFSEVADDFMQVMDRVMEYDKIIFATPIYWYTMTGTMKQFIDRWSQAMREDRYHDLRERMARKKGYVIAVGGDSPYIKGLPLLQQFKYIFDFVHLPFEGYVLGQANKPGEIEQDKKALYSADLLNQTLKEDT